MGPVAGLSIAIILPDSAVSSPVRLAWVVPRSRPGWAEAVAVDDASPDRSVAMVHCGVPPAQVGTLEENRGFPPART